MHGRPGAASLLHVLSSLVGLRFLVRRTRGWTRCSRSNLPVVKGKHSGDPGTTEMHGHAASPRTEPQRGGEGRRNQLPLDPQHKTFKPTTPRLTVALPALSKIMFICLGANLRGHPADRKGCWPSPQVFVAGYLQKTYEDGGRETSPRHLFGGSSHSVQRVSSPFN